MKLIDKSAVVAEINRVLNSYDPNEITSGRYALVHLCDFLDTLEVKEVDLEKEIRRYRMNNPIIGHREKSLYDYMTNVAKHFFELGLKANQENNVIGIFEREVKIDAGGYPYVSCDVEFYDYDKDIPLAKEGDKVKVTIIKRE